MDHEIDIGARLRQARQRRGLTLRDVAKVTKISVRALKAIEQDDFGRLPGGVFRRAYLRAFAAEVGLNANELVLTYRARFEAELPAEPQSAPSLWGDPSRRRRLVMMAAVVGMLIGWWLTWTPARNPHAPGTDVALEAVDLAAPAPAAPAVEPAGTSENPGSIKRLKRDDARRLERDGMARGT